MTATLPLSGGSGEKKWTLADGISEVKRELMLREKVYAYRISTKAMTEQEAFVHMRDMRGVLTFLEFCLKNEARLRQVVTDG